MSSFRSVAERSWPVAWSRVEALFEELPSDAPSGWRWLSAWLANVWWTVGETPATIVVTGGQGAGKSTLTRILADALGRSGQRCATLSLDDFYLGGKQRAELAETIHPLLRTRGVPGTHDVAGLSGALDQLRRGRDVVLPQFDKGLDEPSPSARQVSGPVDTIILEGWCLGVRPESAARLGVAVNTLERLEDPHEVWRSYVNAQLRGDYQSLLTGEEFLLYLQVPDLMAVQRWRGAQERQVSGAQRMTTLELQRFIAHFQRLTLALERQLAGRCDLTVELGPRHGIRACAAGKRSS